MRAISLLALALCVGTVSSASSGQKLCAKGWEFHNGLCYYFSKPSDTLTPKQAAIRCLELDADFVSPTTDAELDFLKSQAQARNAYGWQLNSKKYFNDWENDKVGNNNDNYNYFNSVTGYWDALYTPKLKIETKYNLKDKPSLKNKCLGYNIAQETAYYGPTVLQTWFEDIPCAAQIKVMCQGKKKKFADQVIDNNKWFQQGDLVFWLASDYQSFSDAKSTCQGKNMALPDSLNDMKLAISNKTDSTPFWTAVEFAGKIPKYFGTKDVEREVLTYDPPSDYNRQLVVLNSGLFNWSPSPEYYGSVSVTALQLPYVCKQSISTENQYGCPRKWLRAGKSCYYFNKIKNLKWGDAKAQCEKQESHLVSVNTKLEWLWLEHLGLSSNDYYDKFWTSANDQEQEGMFVWDDKSEVKSGVFPWRDPSKFSRIKDADCTYYDIKTSGLEFFSCDGWVNAACQYTLNDTVTKCQKDWYQYEQTCYNINQGYTYAPPPWIDSCRDRVTGIDVSQISLLRVKTKKVADFLRKTFTSQGLNVGIDLKVDDTGLTWSDYTVPDMSVFTGHAEPDNGNGGKPENCVSLDGSGMARDEDCNLEHPYICEKELGGAASAVVATKLILLLPLVAMVTQALKLNFL